MTDDDLADCALDGYAASLAETPPESRYAMLTAIATEFASALKRQCPTMSREAALRSLNRFLDDVEEKAAELTAGPVGRA